MTYGFVYLTTDQSRGKILKLTVSSYIEFQKVPKYASLEKLKMVEEIQILMERAGVNFRRSTTTKKTPHELLLVNFIIALKVNEFAYCQVPCVLRLLYLD